MINIEFKYKNIKNGKDFLTCICIHDNMYIQGGDQVKNILLICSAGMSTSLLVSKMQKAAKEQNVDVNIWAVGTAVYKNDLPKADVILLGPQVRFMQSEVKKLAGNKPVAIIDMKVYGKIDGNGALKQALDLL